MMLAKVQSKRNRSVEEYICCKSLARMNPPSTLYHLLDKHHRGQKQPIRNVEDTFLSLILIALTYGDSSLRSSALGTRL